MNRSAYAATVILMLCQMTGFAEDRSMPYADAVPFLGIEEAAKQVKKAVFAVQIQGDQQNKDPNDDWRAIGSGFLVSGKKKTVIGITCRHVVVAATKANKRVFMGLDTDKGYQRFACDIAYVDPNADIAAIKPRKALERRHKTHAEVLP